MGVTYQNGVEFGGSSNSADRIMYDETTNVKKKIDGVEGVVNELNTKLSYPLKWMYIASVTTNEYGNFYIDLPETSNRMVSVYAENANYLLIPYRRNAVHVMTDNSSHTAVTSTTIPNVYVCYT